MNRAPYSGYLIAHVERIREMHAAGASTRAIAEALYAAGARSQSRDPAPGRKLRPADHLVNLRGMVIHIERRLGLRVRHIRLLNLRAKKEETPGADPSVSQNDDADVMQQTDEPGGSPNA